MTSPEAFFALVDRHVTGPMSDAGYVKIADLELIGGQAREVTLGAARSRWRLPSLFTGGRKAHALEVGFEGPGEADERWVNYVPGTGELSLLDWRDELDGYADWDVFHDEVVETTNEMERRLRVVGAAMRSRTGG